MFIGSFKLSHLFEIIKMCSDHSTRRKSPSPRRRGIVRVEEILNMPGRKTRPAQMVIFMRGLPGSGKTHVAKLIKVSQWRSAFL